MIVATIWCQADCYLWMVEWRLWRRTNNRVVFGDIDIAFVVFGIWREGIICAFVVYNSLWSGVWSDDIIVSWILADCILWKLPVWSWRDVIVTAPHSHCAFVVVEWMCGVWCGYYYLYYLFDIEDRHEDIVKGGYCIVGSFRCSERCKLLDACCKDGNSLLKLLQDVMLVCCHGCCRMSCLLQKVFSWSSVEPSISILFRLLY